MANTNKSTQKGRETNHKHANNAHKETSSHHKETGGNHKHTTHTTHHHKEANNKNPMSLKGINKDKVLGSITNFAEKTKKEIDPFLVRFKKNVQESFKRANNGTEDLPVLMWYWGVISYAVSITVINWSVTAIHVWLISSLIAIVAVVYYAWHISAVWKCRPKIAEAAPKSQKQGNGKDMSKSLGRKMFLQEPWFSWNPATIIIVVDLIFLLYFAGKI